MVVLKHWSLLFCSVGIVNALSGQLGRNSHILEYAKEIENRPSGSLSQLDVNPAKLYPEHNLSVPVDHFHNESQYAPHSNAFFNLRYWFDASHYKAGGPVIILQGGETDASERLTFLQKGILAQLAQATNGIGVVLEHRYYGKSFPTPNLSVKNLRFLTTQQALADEAYFAQHIKFPGLEHCGDLSSNTTAYIAYGGSYAGGFSAFLRVLYPQIFWGAISSSGVAKAVYNYPQYYESIARYGPPACMQLQKTFMHIVDNILIVKNYTSVPKQLKTVFGLQNVTHNADFASVLVFNGVGEFQGLNWDPAVGDPSFYNYCNNITSSSVLYPKTSQLRSAASKLIAEGGYTPNDKLVNQMLNFIGYINHTTVVPCKAQKLTQDQCFGSYNHTFYQQDSLAQYSWRSWPYQYCTEYGYIQTGDVPAGELPVVSRTLDLEWNTIVCREAFNISKPPNVQAVNKYGGYNLAYSRLAFIGGEWDPWRPITTQAFEEGAKRRSSTVSQPFIVIPAAVHHWDENGVFPNQTTKSFPPQRIVKTQKAEAAFVSDWMQQWHKQHS